MCNDELLAAMSGSAAENEYQIHVHVVQCKHLVDRRGDMVARTEPVPFVGDPVVLLSVDGQDKHTSIVNNIPSKVENYR